MYTFIAEEQADTNCVWTVTEMCHVLEVSRSGFYDWVGRGPSKRDLSDRQLAFEIESIWEASGRTYGAPRITWWLHQQGFNPSAKRVARLMQTLDIQGESGRDGVRTTIVDRKATAASDLVKREFNPGRPDHTWVGDITYLRTGEGWVFLATVIDLYSRRVIGWSIADHMRTDLVCDALKMAVATRGGVFKIRGVIFHSDKGSQYTASDYAELCARNGVIQSMGATGVCWDNSVAESFFATLKKEMYYRQHWATQADARRAVIRWIEGWYNPHRMHSTNGYQSPNQKENRHHHQGQQAA